MKNFTATVVQLITDTLKVKSQKEVGSSIVLIVETCLGDWKISVRKDEKMIFTRFENIEDLEFAKQILGVQFMDLNPYSFKWNCNVISEEETIQALKDKMNLFKKDNARNLVAGDVFFDVTANNRIVQYEYLCLFPSKNNNTKYHIIINKTDVLPVRIYEDHLNNVLEKNILTYDQAKKVLVQRLNELVEYYEKDIL